MSIKILHAGGLDFEGKSVYLTVRASRKEVIQDLNEWLFDYFSARKEEVVKLPELDDWFHSEENDSMWYIRFPTSKQFIWIRSFTVEFK